MTDLGSGWPLEGALGAGGVSTSASGKAISRGRGQLWPRLVAGLLALLYLAGVAVGWATNAVDGYYGISEVDAAAQATRLVIGEVAAGSPAGRAGLRPGDAIVAFDGQAVAAGSRARWAGTSAAPTFQTRPLAVRPGDAPLFRRTAGNRQAGEVRTLSVERPLAGASESGRAEEVKLVLESHLAAPGVVVDLVTRGLVALLTLAVGVFVFLRRPSDIAARLLLSMTGCFALALALLSWNNRPLPADVALAVQLTTAVLLVLGAASLLHLCLAFPSRRLLLVRLGLLGPRAWAPVGGGVILLYLLPLLFALGIYLGPGAIWPWSYLVVIAVLGLALLALVRSILDPPSPIARAQLKWIAGPLVVGLLALALGPGVSALTGARSEAITSTSVVAAWALFPLGVGVAILRYRLFDVDLVFRAAMLYPLLAALLAGAYLAAAQVLGNIAVSFIGPGAIENVAVSALAALVVAALAHPVYRRLQTGLDRLLHGHRLARQLLLGEAMALQGQALPDEVASFLTGHVANRLDLVRAWLVLPSAVIASDGAPLPATLRLFGEPLLGLMRDAKGPTLLLKGEELATGGPAALGADDPVLAAWHAAGARLLLPLRPAPEATNAAGDGLLGLWLLGTRRSGSLLNSEDVEALAQIARQAAVLLGYDRLFARAAVEMQRTARFRRYFSPQIADLIAGEGAGLATHRRELTVLFAELRGVAALSEIAQPEDLLDRLNNCLGTVTQVVFELGGTLDKYLSYGVVAFFGDPLPQVDHADRATQAALTMQRRLRELTSCLAAGSTPLEVGIGLATGWVTAGTIGSPARQEYTVVGDAVNIASRLAAAAKPGEVLVAEKTRHLLSDGIAIVPHGEVTIEGRRQPIAVFGVSAGPEVSAGAPTVIQPPVEQRERGDSVEVVSGALVGAELLARTALFASLTADELQGLASHLRLRRFKKGAIILQPHEASSSFFLIKAGTVKVTRATVTGDEAIMNILGRGEFFGELALLEGQSANSTVVALQVTEVLVLSREAFLACLQSNPRAATAAIGLLSERIRRLSDQLEEAYALELPQRLARRLLALGSTLGRKTDDGVVIDLALTQSELAGMVGASRQRVNRVLADWQDRRLLRLGSYGRMTLLRPDSLTDLSPERLDG